MSNIPISTIVDRLLTGSVTIEADLALAQAQASPQGREDGELDNLVERAQGLLNDTRLYQARRGNLLQRDMRVLILIIRVLRDILLAIIDFAIHLPRWIMAWLFE